MVVDSMVPSTKSPLGTIPHGWRLASTRDVAIKIGSGATPSGGAANYLPHRTNYALIRSQNVFDRYFDTDGLVFISDAQASELSGAAVSEGDVLLNITGDGITFGRACIAPRSVLPACVNQHVTIIRANKKICVPGYLLSYLTHPSIKHYIESFNAGGSRRAITKGHIESFVVPLPPLAEQHAIAHILATLDDKIELNRRMNETLEEMARALFKSWFVDFDPVRAKAEGRRPKGMTSEIAKLFPSEFADSELGKVPRGWRTPTLGFEAKRCGGSIQTGPFGSQLHASDYVDAGIPVIMPQDIALRRVITTRIVHVREHDAARLARHRVQPGDIVYSRRGDVERHALISQRENGWLCGTGCLLVRLGAAWPSPLYASFLLDQAETRAWIKQHAIGATMPNLNTSILASVPFLTPSDDLLRRFESIAIRLEEKMVAHIRENEALTALRDTLLPKLLSGELRIENPDAFLKDHVP